MAKTTFIDGDPGQGIQGTVVPAAFLNAANDHHHDGLAVDGHGALDYAVDSGAANAYVVDLSPALTQYINGMPIYFKVANANTGASTLNVNSLGAKTIKKQGVNALVAGDLKTGVIYCVVYDGVGFQLVNLLMDWPAFRAYRTGGNQSVGVTGPVKVQFNGETLDTHGCYDNATDYRFTPTQAGTYMITAQVAVGSCDTNSVTVNIYKNGALYSKRVDFDTFTDRYINISDMLYMNGSTDYIEIFIESSTENSYDVGEEVSWFAGSRIA